ncbi:MAG: DUF87 domain-containing protein [Acidobacteriaceae bacterium]|jgi:hypothetical protein|nr:DUF87 domain-containing protein [Acidobacteriaceae bacterium]
MVDYEKLGVFYVGRRLDLTTKQPNGDLVLYDSKDLVTHALCVGMTGSGKTGLGIALIEEAAIDGIPVIVIDPKGDLSNLLLTFPNLQGTDFEPWVDADEAARAGKSVSAFAAGEAERWNRGLNDWGQDKARIQRVRDAAEFTIYTPGSRAGRPVSALTSFARPVGEDPEGLRERVQTTVSSLLALAGVTSDPLTGREHMLLSAIVQAAWQAGESPTLEMLIQRIQHPPMTRIGVLDLESFFPAKERFALVMAINALVASPGFEAWTEGEPIDIDAFLRTPAGKPRVSIFSIAHLDEAQRMFFVSLLLNALAGWMRTQRGTSSLRAMLYMDEIFGFFPPVAAPPAKAPLLTLLKQGRAAGLGVVLATQNPADLDYKGLANIGTWWLGRLQTERDKARLLDGLGGAGDTAIDRAQVDGLLSSLGRRVFVMRNVHEEGLTLFETRWTLSYLRGPLNRDEIRRLTGPAGSVASAAPVVSRDAPASVPAASETLAAPPISPDVPQYFSPDAFAAGAGPLKPFVYGAANLRITDAKTKVDITRLVTLAVPVAARGAVAVDWNNAVAVDWAPEMLERDAPEGARYAPLPSAMLNAKNYTAWSKQFLVRTADEVIELMKSPSTGDVSRPDESERDFRARLQLSAREARDRQLDALRKRFAPRMAALDEKLRRAQQAVVRESEQVSGQKVQTAISMGATIFSALFGRKVVSASTLGRATTAARGVGRVMKESDDVGRAKENVEAIAEQRKQLDADLAAETTAIDASTGILSETFETIAVRPKKTDVTVKLVALVWSPDAR